MVNIWYRVRALLRREQLDAEIEEELRSHVDMQTEANLQQGMGPQEARSAALRKFGWVESIKEKCREARGMGWIERFGQDLRYGASAARATEDSQ